MRNQVLLLAIVGALISNAAPASALPFPTFRSAPASNGLGDLAYRATDRMIQSMRPRPGNAGIVTPVDQIIVTTIVSVDNLERSSTLGRLTSQMVLNRLTQLGYQARDVTFARALDISDDGEKILSRDTRKLSRDYNASAIVAGTYAVGGKSIFVTLRLLSAADGSVISSADFQVPLDADTWPLVDSTAPRLTASPETLIYGPDHPVARR